MIKGQVSVIVPIYKVEKYLEKCLKSISEQTYKDIQVILVDDGSPDNCPSICDAWVKNDPRMQVIHQKNQGVSAARNSALKVVQGEFLAFVDADDWIEPTMIEHLIHAMDMDECVDAAFCGYKEVEEKTEHTFRIVRPVGNKVVGRNEGVAEIFGEYSTMLWNKLYRTSVLLDHHEFDRNLKIGEDELWMIQNLKNARKIALLDEPLYCYRSRSDGASKNFTLSKARLSEIDSQKMVLAEIKAYGAENLTLLAQKRMYFSCQTIMKIAFYQDDTTLFKQIDQDIDEVRKIWFANHNNVLGKYRRLLVEHMMRTHFPKKFVKLFDK